jgi:hypothetical protein
LELANGVAFFVYHQASQLTTLYTTDAELPLHDGDKFICNQIWISGFIPSFFALMDDLLYIAMLLDFRQLNAPIGADLCRL